MGCGFFGGVCLLELFGVIQSLDTNLGRTLQTGFGGSAGEKGRVSELACWLTPLGTYLNLSSFLKCNSH